MSESLEKNRLRITTADLDMQDRFSQSRKPIEAAWSGYTQPYVKNIIKGGLKALKLLSTLTFDMQLLMWVKGLEGHLKKRMKEAEQQKQKEKSYKF